MGLATIPEAVEDFKRGKFVIVVDDEDRENEGDLVVAAQLVTPDHISFMTRHGSGLVCMPVKARRLDELGIAPMVERNTSRLGTAFSVSIDARDVTTTGASAHDRAATIRKVVDVDAKPPEPALLGLVSRLVPALVGGNTVVLVASDEHPLAAIELAECVATADVPAGVVNILTGQRKELAPWLASHMDVAGLDLAGADGDSAELEKLGAENVKRIVHGRADVQSPYEITPFLELKTVWHPIGL